MKKKDTTEEKNWFSVKYVIVFLIIIIVLLILNNNKGENINYWVDGVYLESYTYYNEKIATPRSILHFNLFSDKESNIVKRSLFGGETTYYNKLDPSKQLYFKCHNKTYDEFYYFYVSNEEEGLTVTVKDNTLSLDTYSSDYNNFYEVKDQIVNENAKEIDYCTFLGIVK